MEAFQHASLNPMKDFDATGIKAVLFDAAGTLFDTRGTVGELYRDVAIDYGSEATAEAIQDSFLRHWHDSGGPRDKESWKSMVRSIFGEVGPVSDFPKFFEELYELFRSLGGWRCFPETSEVLGLLKARGYRLGIVSNFDARLNDVLEALQLESLVDSATIPSSCGYAKPDSRIFDAATRSLDVGPAEAMFVGDNLIEDVAAASRAGLSAVLIHRYPGSPPTDIRSISDLREILSILNISTGSAP